MKTLDESLPVLKATEILLLSHINSLPVEPSFIAQKYGFIVKDIGDDHLLYNIKGLTVYNERTNRFAILFNSIFADFNFTIAHELGHIFLGHHKDGLLVGLGATKSNKYRQYEKMADLFAFSLLLPRPLVLLFMCSSSSKTQALNKICRTFCVQEKTARAAIQIALNNSPVSPKLMELENRILELFKISVQ